jgi:hypothetical protein
MLMYAMALKYMHFSRVLLDLIKKQSSVLSYDSFALFVYRNTTIVSQSTLTLKPGASRTGLLHCENGVLHQRVKVSGAGDRERWREGESSQGQLRPVLFSQLIALLVAPILLGGIWNCKN